MILWLIRLGFSALLTLVAWCGVLVISNIAGTDVPSTGLVILFFYVMWSTT